MNFALNSLERQRDLGLLVMRVVVGGTYVFYGWDKLMAGPKTWEKLGHAVNHLGLSGGYLYWGMGATFAELLGGAFLVLGLLVRPSAIALCGTMAVAAIAAADAAKWTGSDGVTGFFYPLSMAAVLFGLIFLGGGKYSLDGGGGGGSRKSGAPAKE